MAESSADRLARLLVLVPWLSAHSGISKADAARHFGRTVKQLESDLQLLTFTGPGLYGGELVDIAFDDETVTVYDHQGLSRPVELSGDEAAALLVGLHALQQLPDLDATQVARLIEKLGRYRSTHADLDVRVVSSEHAAVIARAITEERDLDLTYRHPLRDDLTDRTVTPMQVITRDGVDYLNAWCHTAEAMRTFRLDRMLRCELGGVSVAHGATASAADASAAGLTATVELPAAKAHVLEQVPHAVLARTQVVRAEVRYSDPRWLSTWVIANAPQIRVVEPSTAAEHARSRATLALAAYAGIDG